MSSLIGIVYKYEKHNFSSSSWKKYFLALDERTGLLSYVKRSGKVEGFAELDKIFLSIHCRRFDSKDHRLTKSRFKFAPYALVIPMYDKKMHTVQNEEFALGSMDEMETWLRKFAESVGASNRLRKIESEYEGKWKRSKLVKPGQGVLKTLEKNFKAQFPISRPAKFNENSRSAYEPSRLATLWNSFIANEQNCYHDTYEHPFDGFAPGDSGYWSQPFSFTDAHVIDPSSGSIMDPGSYHAPYGGDSNGYWSSFLSHNDGGGSGHHANNSGHSGGYFGHVDSGGYSGGGCDGGGVGCS